MSSMFKAPKPPPVKEPEPAPIAPTRTAEEVQQLAAQQKLRLGTAGRATTQLTGGLGVDSSQTYASAATLLGQTGR